MTYTQEERDEKISIYERNDIKFHGYNVDLNARKLQGRVTVAVDSQSADMEFQSALSAVYSIFIFTSLFGNSIIIHIIRTDNSMKTTTNYLILNQACGDLYRTLIESTNIAFRSMGNQWFGGFLGLITCKLFLTSLFLPTIFSVWILAVIAVDRFYAVTRPLQTSPLSRHLKKIVFTLWVWSLASSTDVLIKGSMKKTEDHFICHLERVYEQWKLFYSMTVSLNLFLPLLISGVLYVIVCSKLWSRKVPGEGTNQNRRQAEAIKTARKVTLMMITLVVLYLLCFVPFYIGITLKFFGYVNVNLEKLTSSLLLIAFAYSGINPYVYFIYSRNFRNGFKNNYRNFCKKSRVDTAVHDFRGKNRDFKQTTTAQLQSYVGRDKSHKNKWSGNLSKTIRLEGAGSLTTKNGQIIIT
ncbi:substance-P receptor-like [Stylophora pistillata]|uniref:substance-P receptor-like n=1 Tax=Stylophora pistillata TaxID=50429 RepID=UPI000C0578BA|nr:substance-P receptor-like [Stylophora pistillata]